MAALALGFIGTAIGGQIGGTILGVAVSSIGGFIGSTIGSLIDNRLFNKGQHQEGPRLSDLTVTVATLGNPIPLLYGPENRVSGNVIWKTDLIETAKTHKEGGKGGGPSVSITEYSYRLSIAIAVSGRPASAVTKILANGRLLYDAESGDDAGLWGALRFYPGSLTQTPDPTIEAYEGAGETEAFIGVSYFVLEDFIVDDWGGQLPNIEAFVDAGDDTLDGVLRDIMDRCGLDPERMSVGTISGPIRGYAISRQTNGLGAIEPLALAYAFNVAEHAGDLRMSYRDSAPLSTIPLRDLGGSTPGNPTPDKIKWSRALESSLPRSATVSYPDPDRDLQPGAQTSVRSTGSADNILSVQVAVVMTADQAKQLADRLLWEAWLARETGETTTDDRWLELVVDQAYWFETPAGMEPLTIMSKTRGANGLIQVQALRNRLEVYRSNNPGGSAPAPDKVVLAPGDSTIILLDIPILLDADDDPGFYWGVVGTAQGWRGADARRALDAGGPYSTIEPQGFELTVGDVTGTLGPGPSDIESEEIDTTTVLTVVLRHEGMTLEDADADGIEAGLNACYVGPTSGHGGEVLQFMTADLVGPLTYELTNLIRGQKGTDFARDDHGAGEMFVLLEVGNLKRANFGVDDLEKERAYKAVSVLQAEADAATVLFTNTGVGLRPYSPIFLDVSGATGGDLELSWTRRSRLTSGLLGEAEERYVVRIMNAGGTVVIRETEVTTPEFTYTLAMQTADFGGAVSDLRWRVAQVSATYGPGVFAELSGPV